MSKYMSEDRWAIFGTALFIVLFLFLLIATTWAHDSWISRENLRDPVSLESCCNAMDCQEELGIEAVEGGYLIKSTGEVIHRERIIWRSPGGWWRCRYLSGTKSGLTRCLIGPPQGS